MLRFLTALTLASAPAVAAAPPVKLIAPPTPVLNGEQQAALDCAVSFGLIAGEQRAGRPGSNRWPAMGERHREYFVRVSAKLMDDYGIGREQIARLAQASAQRLVRDRQAIDAAMPTCLALLDASGE